MKSCNVLMAPLVSKCLKQSIFAFKEPVPVSFNRVEERGSIQIARSPARHRMGLLVARPGRISQINARYPRVFHSPSIHKDLGSCREQKTSWIRPIMSRSNRNEIALPSGGDYAVGRGRENVPL